MDPVSKDKDINEKPIENKARNKKKPAISKKDLRKYCRALFMTSLVMLLVFGVASKISISNPYALSVDGEEICYVRDKAAANEALEVLLGNFIPEEASLKAVDIKGSISMEAVGGSIDKNDLKDPEEAAEMLAEVYEATGVDGDGIKVTTLSTRIEEREYTPEPILIQDDTMLAGEETIVTEAVKGTMNVTVAYTCVNGEVVSTEDISTEITQEGQPAEIKRGILGLPDGEDWRTYSGNPVYEHGEDVVATAMNYLGAPYKYGGTSLTNGIDCVAFVVQMFRKYGVYLPYSRSAVQHAGVAVPYSKAQVGDIICYKDHVALYLGNGRVIHAIPKKGVSIGNVNMKRLISVRRILPDN